MLMTDRDAGVNAIESLMERQGSFDYILLETTGLADPGNIAPLFWLDEGLGSSIFLDGIVTLVDAKNLLRNLEEPAPADDESSASHVHAEVLPALSTAHMQIAHADVVVVNKRDLVSQQELDLILNRVRSINGLAVIHVTEQSKVPSLEGVLLDLHAYDSVDSINLNFDSKGHSHLDAVSCDLKHESINEAGADSLSRRLLVLSLYLCQSLEREVLPGWTAGCVKFCGN